MKLYQLMSTLILFSIFFFSCSRDKDTTIDDNETSIEVSDSSFQFSFDDKNYTVFFINLDWESAAAYATNLNAYLVEIDNQAEQDTIFQVLTTFSDKFENSIAPDGGDFPHFWLGANDFSQEGFWVWDGNGDGQDTNQFWQGSQNGTSINGLYNNWGYEPSDGAGGQDAAGIVPVDWTNGNAGTWNDIKKTNELYFIVEFE